MAFEQNLVTFNFNKETLEMMVNEKMERDEIVESMEMAGFNKKLTKFLMDTKPVFYNSLMLRMRLYGKQKKNEIFVKKALENFKDSHPLVEYLFGNSLEEPKQVETKKVEKVYETKEKVMMIEENVESDVESEEDDDEETEKNDPLDKFYQQFIKESEGSELKTKETYDAFTKWYASQFDEDETPDKKEFKNYLSEKLGKSGKKGWTNYVLVE